jgi:hypothetical protein
VIVSLPYSSDFAPPYLQNNLFVIEQMHIAFYACLYLMARAQLILPPEFCKQLVQLKLKEMRDARAIKKELEQGSQDKGFVTTKRAMGN